MVDPRPKRRLYVTSDPIDPVADVIAWVLTEAAVRDDTCGLLSGLIERLSDLGLALSHVRMGMATIDPMVRGMSFACWRDGASLVETLQHDQTGDETFQRSPIHYVQSRGLLAYRWRLAEKAHDDEPRSLKAFRNEGATDYLLRMVLFPRPETTDNGVALSFVTDRPGGFSDEDVAILERLMPALALAGRTISIGRTVREVLSVYLGTRTAGRVLAGEIRRGQGQTISAAILIADLRGFTTLSGREDAVRVVGWLDEHLEAIGTAVERHGGEVLKFLGDGLLAIFTFDGDAGSAERVCGRAIAAAELALKQTGQLNTDRALRGEPTLALGIALHAGEVVYGNVGASRRLDFTVIGSAVNEASRMEGLCGPLGRDLLLSEAFASLCGRATKSLGKFTLRGLDGERTIRVLAGRPDSERSRRAACSGAGNEQCVGGTS